jgi:lysophospholipase L1-like esterase
LPKHIIIVLIIATASFSHAQGFVCGKANASATRLTEASIYSSASPGFDLQTVPKVKPNSCFSEKPFFFSIALPEGNYRITVVLGAEQATVTTVRAEARRLMLEKVVTRPNSSVKRTFDVNLRMAEIGGAEANRVKLKPRELTNLDWDGKLTLEFNGDHPSFRSLTITPIKETTIYLAGDSTVVDQDIEPWTAWGQVLPRFLRPGVVIANHAESGETTRSFVNEERLAKIMSLIQPGDYLFIQFGHNDSNTKRNPVPIDEYKKLLEEYISQARSKGATPVLVTPMNRRTFDAAGKITNSLSPYPEAVREVAVRQHTPLIDLNAMSKTLFDTMGPKGTLMAFMYYSSNSFPNQPDAINDSTHFNEYGAYELAQCVALGIRNAKLPLRRFLVKGAADFDPAKPDPQSEFSQPITPSTPTLQIQ